MNVEPQINNSVFAQLNHCVYQSGQALEGNIYYLHHTPWPYAVCADYCAKRCHWHSLAASVDHVIEIGFNAGHSALLALSANNTVTYTGIDICYHSYTRGCAGILKQHYGSRFTFIDLASDLAWSSVDQPTGRTLWSIDGGHDADQLARDLRAVRDRAQPGDCLWIDDTSDPKLRSVVTAQLAKVEDHQLWITHYIGS